MAAPIPPILLEIDEKIAGEKRRLRQIRVSSEKVSLGTSAHNDIDLKLTSQHFSVEVRYSDAEWSLINTSKSSRVRCNGATLLDEHPLRDGDVVALDQHRMVFRRIQTEERRIDYDFIPQPESDEALWNYLIDENQLDEVMVNGSESIFIDFQGNLLKSPWRFSSNEFLSQKISEATGSQHGWSSWRLKKYLRVHAAQSPIVEAPHICIRKGRPNVFTLDELESKRFGTPEQIGFLKDCIERRESILISGPTSTGKTVLMRGLVEKVSHDERLVILEEEAETTWPHPHAVLVETGRGGLKDGIRESLRFRPSRLIVSEIRGDEAVEFLQSINTGHRGGLTTIHANSPRDAITRVETLVLGSGWSVEPQYIRAQIASAINILVQLSRDEDGSRKIESIQRITGMQQGVVLLSDPIGIETTGIAQPRKRK